MSNNSNDSNEVLINSLIQQLKVTTKTDRHRHIRKLFKRESLSKGYSGASIELYQTIYYLDKEQDTSQEISELFSPQELPQSELIVLKTFDSTDRGESDYFREEKGYDNLWKHWQGKHLTRTQIFYEDPNQPLRWMASSFAQKSSLKVNSIRKLMHTHQLPQALDHLIHHYMFLAQNTTLEHCAFDSLQQLIQCIIGDDMWNKWQNPSLSIWSQQDQWIVIGEQIYENPVYLLTQDQSIPISKTYMTPVWTHGDLNVDNVIFDEKYMDQYVFIDLEKARCGSPFYDLSFLIAWMIKLEVLEAEDLQNFDPNNSQEVIRQELIDLIAYLSTHDVKLSMSDPRCYYLISKGIKILSLQQLLAGLHDIKDVLYYDIDDDRESMMKLTLGTAFLIRAYYEAREFHRRQHNEDPQTLNMYKTHSNFYRDLATVVMTPVFKEIISNPNQRPHLKVVVDSDT